MRMRRKAWTEPLLDNCPFFVTQPSTHRGHWAELFGQVRPTWLEIGCGKGVSTAQMAYDNRGVNLIAVDEVRTVMAVAIKNVLSAYGESPVDNILFSAVDATRIYDTFSAEDKIERIIINFCNPWDERAKHHKRRLTHPRQLMQYRDFLMPGGKLYFKTDNDALFTATLRYLNECAFSVETITYDLHASGYAPNYVSEHERLYVDRGCKIKFLIAKMQPMPEGHVPNLE